MSNEPQFFIYSQYRDFSWPYLCSVPITRVIGYKIFDTKTNLHKIGTKIKNKKQSKQTIKCSKNKDSGNTKQMIEKLKQRENCREEETNCSISLTTNESKKINHNKIKQKQIKANQNKIKTTEDNATENSGNTLMAIQKWNKFKNRMGIKWESIKEFNKGKQIKLKLEKTKKQAKVY